MKKNFIFTFFFEKNIKKLRKKYQNIDDDVKEVLYQIDDNPEQGERIQGLKERVYKIRIPSSDIQKGKRGAYRMIYYYIDNNQDIILLTIYVKAKQENISVEEIRMIMERL